MAKIESPGEADQYDKRGVATWATRLVTAGDDQRMAIAVEMSAKTRKVTPRPQFDDRCFGRSFAAAG